MFLILCAEKSCHCRQAVRVPLIAAFSRQYRLDRTSLRVRIHVFICPRVHERYANDQYHDAQALL